MARGRHRTARTLRWGAAALLTVTLAALAFLPELFAEYFMWARLHQIAVVPPAATFGDFEPRPGEPLGTVVAGWRVQQIAPDTYALGEPADDLDNYEYLLLGRDRALLIDAGATPRDIMPVVTSLTHLPVTVLPTHLHYDHTAGLRNAADIALVDLPETRARADGDHFSPSRYQYLQREAEGAPPDIRVGSWLKPDAGIALGGRTVRLLSTPGHTPTSVSIYDPTAKLLFTGDLIYTTTLYAFVPGASLSDYVRTFDRLLAEIPADVKIYGAHCCRNDAPAQAPFLGMADITEARAAIIAIETGQARGRGLLIRRYPVNDRMTLLTLYPFANW